MAHEQVWWPSLGFPLGVTTFTKAECNKLQATFQAKLVAKMGFNRTMANSIRYGPIQYGGLGLKTIWNEQGLKHALLAITHLRASDADGTNMMISLSASQLEAGTDKPILEQKWDDYSKYITPTWITKTWEFLSENNIQLRIPDTWTPLPQRINDTFIMDHATRLYNKNPATLQKINRCRMYLKATTISDITEATGRSIEDHAWKGNLPKHRKSQLNFPQYKRPPPQDWTAFRKFLKKLLTDPTNTKSNLHEDFRLGPWHRQRHETWQSTYSPSTERLYIQKPNHTLYSYGKGRANTRFEAHTRTNHNTLPNDNIPITITSQLNTTGIPTQTNRTQQRQHNPTTPRTQTPANQTDQFNCPNIPNELRSILSNLPPWQKQRIENLSLCPGFETLYSATYLMKQLGSASDGSAPYHGSFAWKIVNLQTESTLAQGGGSCQHYTEMTSHRMETDGILGRDILLTALQLWKPLLPPYDSTILHYCDNQEAVDRSNKSDLPHLTNFTLHDYDQHNAIKSLRNKHPPSKTIWIKGHQDKNQPTETLPYPTRLNIECDELANNYHQQNPHFLEPPPTTQLFKNDQSITWNYTGYIRFQASEGPLRKRILEKHPDWNNKTFDSIAWTAIGRANSKLPQHRQARTTKLQHNWIPTLKRMQNRDNSINGRCPNCNTRQYETKDHIIRCPNTDIANAREIALVNLTVTLSKMETPPDLSHALLYGIEKWIDQERDRNNPTPIDWPPGTYTYDHTKHKPIADAFHMQSQIGWDELMRGRICKGWGDVIQQHYQRTKAPKAQNRDTWEHNTIDKIWEIFDATWTARNALKHGATEDENNKIRDEKTNQKINDIYRYKQHKVSIQDLRLFHTPLATILHKSHAYKQAWLKSINVAITAWAKEQGNDNPHDPGPQAQA